MPITKLAVTKRYYPKLSEVMTLDDLPEFLSFAKDGLMQIFDKIYYKNLQYSKFTVAMRHFTAWILIN